MVDEVQVASDWVFERGTYTIPLTLKAWGAQMQDIGNCVTIYEQQPNGVWGMARDNWKSYNSPFMPR